LPAAYFADAQVAASDAWAPALAAVSVPQNYTKQTPEAAELINVTPGSLMQGQSMTLTVTGVNFAPPDPPPGTPPVTYKSFAVTTTGSSQSGVTITNGEIISNTQASLVATVDAQAGPGPRNLSVGAFSLPNCLTVIPRPLATGCDTTQLAQQLLRPVTQVVTVTGQGFSNPVVTLTGSDLVSCSLTSHTATLLTVTVSIDESTWEPGGSRQLAGLRPDIPKNPVTPPHPPTRVPVKLSLNVTPAPPNPTVNTFQITLDSIV
jgi:hypothetical protein